tara:strand:+ start:491 stop:760 length:270 start_codon:yes stop_codon:yes gene_type:complete
VAEISSGRPYTEDGDLRTFFSAVKSDDLIWHRDREDRRITVIEGQGWQFQFNGSIPIELRVDKIFEIPKDMYHRIIRGKTKLVLRVEKI